MGRTTRFEISQQVHKSTYSMHSAHSHSYYEMYYLMDGKCNLFIQDTVYSISSGTIAFIPADILHKTTYTGSKPNERLYIEFTQDYIEGLTECFGETWLKDNLFGKIIYIPKDQRPVINSLLYKIQTEHQSTERFAELLTKTYFHELIVELLRHCDNTSFFTGDNNIKIADEAIQRAMNFIARNYQHKVTLGDIAQLLHLNASYLSKKFKTVNGMGFSEYLNNVRINQSEKLLLETSMSITEIAFSCGYENSNYFGDAFRHINGISPSTFRKLKGNVGSLQAM